MTRDGYEESLLMVQASRPRVVSPAMASIFLRKTLQPTASPCSGSQSVERKSASNPLSRATCPITCMSPQLKPRAYASEALILLFVYEDATYFAKKSGSQRMAPGIPGRFLLDDSAD